MLARTKRTCRLLAAAALAAGVSAGLGGCNDAQAGSLLGAGIGALAGQAIGGDTEATLIGTGVGAGLGYILGNEVEKSRNRHYGYWSAPPRGYRHPDCAY